MKKMLFISPELPYPPQSGGKVKSLKLLNALAQRYDVTLACPLKMEDRSHLEAFRAISPCCDHLHEDLHVPRSAKSLLRSYSLGIPLNVHRTASTPLTQKIAQVATEQDIIVLDHYESYHYLPQHYSGLSIYHAHNAYFKMWERYATLPGNPAMRLAAKLEALRVRRYEKCVAIGTDMTFAAPNDALELIAQGVPSDNMHNTFHLGDDQQLDLPDLRYGDTRKKLVYVGFLGWEPNAQGLLWFIEEVWPQLLSRHPDLTFDIVGKNPDQRLKNAVAKHHGITLRGFVADLQEVYKDSRVSVAPLLFGSGMKVKVLDAMARGTPTVTTSVGAEGIEVESGKHLLVADEPRHMAVQIDLLLSDPALWQRLQFNSRELIKERYTWSRLFTQMHSSIAANLLQRSNSPLGRNRTLLQHAG